MLSITTVYVTTNCMLSNFIRVSVFHWPALLRSWHLDGRRYRFVAAIAKQWNCVYLSVKEGQEGDCSNHDTLEMSVPPRSACNDDAKRFLMRRRSKVVISTREMYAVVHQCNVSRSTRRYLGVFRHMQFTPIGAWRGSHDRWTTCVARRTARHTLHPTQQAQRLCSKWHETRCCKVLQWQNSNWSSISSRNDTNRAQYAATWSLLWTWRWTRVR